MQRRKIDAVTDNDVFSNNDNDNDNDNENNQESVASSKIGSNKQRQKQRPIVLKCISILFMISGLMLISKSIGDNKNTNDPDLSLESRDETDLKTWENAYKKSLLTDEQKNVPITIIDTNAQNNQVIRLGSTADKLKGVPNHINTNSSKVSFPAEPISKEIKMQLNPKSGSHTSTNNAVFGFAQGYSYDIYISFLESLSDTGYTGDVVLSVSADVSQETLDYLASMSNVIVYKDEWDCVNGNKEPVKNPGEGRNHCKVTGLYYDKDSKAVEDHREYRPVATARYELYYAWSTKYSPNSWILLIDFRDTYFQLNPFENLTSTTPPALLLFEENRESVDLGRSSFNSRWLKTAYGRDTEKKFSSYPVICSGSSIGSNQYIQIYLRGMIQEYDNTHCILKGCDQGFHNYLYYSSKLSNWIPTIQVYEQGKGLINNLAALRNKPLKEWGILSEDESYKVLNWDKSLSAVAHQYDRDGDLRVVRRQVKRGYMQRVAEEKNK